MLDAERLGHRHRHHQAARLERAGRQPAFVLDQDFGRGEPGGNLRQRHRRGNGLAQADDVARTAHRQQLAVTPQVERPARQRVLAEARAHALEIVAHQERLAGAREIVHLVGGVALAREGAFEMGNEARALGPQIFIV